VGKNVLYGKLVAGASVPLKIVGVLVGDCVVEAELNDGA
jgi:hypothetical protein